MDDGDGEDKESSDLEKDDMVEGMVQYYSLGVWISQGNQILFRQGRPRTGDGKRAASAETAEREEVECGSTLWLLQRRSCLI
jgi:hypothetical protein